MGDGKTLCARDPSPGYANMVMGLLFFFFLPVQVLPHYIMN
jgi:hypothetical protein